MSYNNTVMSEVLRHLSDGAWHSLFSLHQRFRLSPSSILEIIKILKNKDIVQLDGVQVKLNPITNLKTLGELRHALRDREISIEESDRFSPPELGINQVYLPKIDLLSRELIAKPKECS